MRKIDKLIYRAVIPPFGIAFVVLSFVVFLNEFGRLSELVITRNASPETILILAGSVVPSILIFSLPLAYLIGVLIGLSGLSGESQIIALRACGVSLKVMLRPVVTFAVSICLITGALSLVVMPKTNDILRSMKDRINLRQATSQIQPRVFVESDSFKNIVFYVDDLSVGRQRWSGVFLSDSTDPKSPRTILSESGSWVTDQSGTKLQLHLEKGVIYEVDPSDPGRDKISLFMATDVPIPLTGLNSNDIPPGVTGPNSAAAKPRKPEETTTLDLWRGNPALPAAVRLEQRVELHRRIAIPFSVIGFSLIGLALGITTRKGGRTSGFVISLSVVLFFYVSFLNGLRLARAEQLPPWLGAWAANILTCSMGVFFIMLAERATAVTQALQRLKWLERLRARISRQPSGQLAPQAAYTPCNPSTSLTGRILGACFPRLLDVYISRGFMVHFFWASIVCTILFELLTLFDLLDDIIRNDARFLVVMGYFVFFIPQILMLVVPMSVLLAILISFGILEKHSEITALKAGGWSLYRISVPVLLMAGFICTSLYFLQDYVLPYSNIRQDSLRNVIKGRSATTSALPQRKWVFGESNRIFNYEYFDADRNTFVRLNVFEVDMKATRVRRRLFAERATVTATGIWVFEDGWIRDFRDESAGFQRIKTLQVTLPEKSSYFQTEIFQPKESAKLTYLELKEYITYLKKAGYNATELQVALYRKIAFPLSCVVMAVLAIPFSFSMGRRGAFYGITVSITIAITYWGVFSMFEKMGTYGLLVPLLAAWAPNLLFAAAGLTLLFTIRT
jgi:LPS export ABC transporter permease LptG/LPS export ABC transporter permease LptF